MSEELRPCPFCGGQPEMQINGPTSIEAQHMISMGEDWDVSYYAACQCTSTGPERLEEWEAATAWNTRPEPSNTLIEEQAARIASLENEIETAKNDLRSFMTSFVRENFFDNTGWQPLPDLLGMLSQMDNASTVARTYRDRADASQARLSEAVKVLEELWYAVLLYRTGIKDAVPMIASGGPDDPATINALMMNNEILDGALSSSRAFLTSLGKEDKQ